MIKVAIDSGPVNANDIGRGIGFHTIEVVKRLRKKESLDIDTLDFLSTDLHKYDIIHYPKFNPYLSKFPFSKPTRTVITIHDLTYLIYPKEYPPGLKGTLRFLRNKAFAKKADAIITISQTSKKDIIKYLGIEKDKIHVIYLAARKSFTKIEDVYRLKEVKEKYNLPHKFVLYVGGVNYNKNLITLASACEKVQIPLVAVGKHPSDEELKTNHPEVRPYRELLGIYGGSKYFIKLGFVPDDELVSFFNLASVYCEPSLYEGFSLTIIEAMASNTPVVASDIPVHREVAGDAVLYSNPHDYMDFAEKILRISGSYNIRKALIEKGNSRVAKYNWDKTALGTQKVYEEVMKP